MYCSNCFQPFVAIRIMDYVASTKRKKRKKDREDRGDFDSLHCATSKMPA